MYLIASFLFSIFVLKLFLFTQINVMKKLLPTIFGLFLFTSAHAQILKGSTFLGGDIGGSTQKTKAESTTINKQNSLIISPVFGKAIKDNLIFGVNAGFSTNNYENTPADQSKSTYYSAGTFLRKYKNIGTSGFYIFLQGGLNAIYLDQDYKNPYSTSYNNKRITIAVKANPGLSYAVSKKLHLETGFNNLLSLEYFNEKNKNHVSGVKTKTNGFGIYSSLNNINSNLYLGFRILLSK
jgi:hypothetical protein